jgi:membrane protein implicated in regulation of membrane protease activity
MRDSLIIFGVLAILIVVIAMLTGGDLARAVLAAGAFFLAANAWTWWRVRRRAEREPWQ